MFRFKAWRELTRLLLFGEPEPDRVEEWHLADRVEADPFALVRDENDQVGIFFLGLAAVFNDIKGVVLLEQYLNAKGRPLPDVVSEYAGQWRVTHIQIHRWLAGIMLELMIWIRDHHRKRVFDDPSVMSAVASLPERHRAAWLALVEGSLVDGGQNRDRPHDLWQDIRNSASFHYDPKRLAAGYLGHFRDDRLKKPTGSNAAAMYSPGNTMRAARFYYADAAQQVLLRERGRRWDTDNVDEAIVRKAEQINDAISPLLYRFIHGRTGRRAY